MATHSSSCLENSMDRGAWRTTVHGVTESDTTEWLTHSYSKWGLQVAHGKESTCQCKRCGFDPWVGKIPWWRKWQPTPELLLGKSHGQRSLMGYSPWGCKEWGKPKWLSTPQRGDETIAQKMSERTRKGKTAQQVYGASWDDWSYVEATVNMLSSGGTGVEKAESWV